KQLARISIFDPKSKTKVTFGADIASGPPLRLIIRAVASTGSTGTGFGYRTDPTLVIGAASEPAFLSGRADLTENEGVLVSGSDMRESSESAIDVLARMLVEILPQQDFAQYARTHLFADDPGKPQEAVVIPHRDWVLFHKRREWTEATFIEPPPGQ